MVTAAVPAGANIARPMSREEKKVIFASSLGTVFEWYDFYLYGSLAAIIAKQYFASLDPTAAFIAALLAFASGFLVRPFGALVFGRLGDMIGRKYTFLVTIMIMGTSTFIVGLLPGYGSIGIAAPIILVGLRLLQGLALGGEYGGAATYVAEHSPHGKRGAYTSWIQTTATLGLFLSLIVIIAVKEGSRRHGVQRLGLACAVPAVVLPADRLGLDPAQPERDARLQAHEGRGQDLEGAAHRSAGQLEQRQDRAAGADRPHRGPGRRLVHGAVLCPVLPDRAA